MHTSTIVDVRRLKVNGVELREAMELFQFFSYVTN